MSFGDRFRTPADRKRIAAERAARPTGVRLWDRLVRLKSNRVNGIAPGQIVKVRNGKYIRG